MNERRGRLRFTWGDAVLAVLPVFALLIASAQSRGLDQPSRRAAEGSFWLGALIGAIIAGLWIAMRYLPHVHQLRDDFARRARSVRIMWVALPLIASLVLIGAPAAPDWARFSFWGLLGGFIAITMLGYGALVLLQRRT